MIDPSSLSDEEIALVVEHREKLAKQQARNDFVSDVLATAAKFHTWSQKTGEGLTFSTFVNSYGYEGSNARSVYDALEKIYDLVRDLAK